MTVASIVSPAISGAMIGTGFGLLLLCLFVACCGLAVGGAQWLRLSLTDRQDRQPAISPSEGADGAAEA